MLAEGAGDTVESVSFQASGSTNDQTRKCEQREVEADEGYGVSRKEMRIVCH